MRVGTSRHRGGPCLVLFALEAKGREVLLVLLQLPRQVPVGAVQRVLGPEKVLEGQLGEPGGMGARRPGTLGSSISPRNPFNGGGGPYRKMRLKLTSLRAVVSSASRSPYARTSITPFRLSMSPTAAMRETSTPWSRRQSMR